MFSNFGAPSRHKFELDERLTEWQRRWDNRGYASGMEGTGVKSSLDDWAEDGNSGLAEYIKSQKVNEALGAADEAAIKRSKHKTAKEQEIYLLLCYFRPTLADVPNSAI